MRLSVARFATGPGRAWDCSNPTLNICRNKLEQAKTLEWPALSMPLPYARGLGFLKTRKSLFFNLFNIIT